MKRLFLQTLLLLAVLSASGQIVVESFRRLEIDLTAIMAGTQEIDQNGEVAALIKVVTTQQGFTFDGGMLGIVKVVQQPAEIWVYVPRKLQKISIAHPDLGLLRDYYFPVPIEVRAFGHQHEVVALLADADLCRHGGGNPAERRVEGHGPLDRRRPAGHLCGGGRRAGHAPTREEIKIGEREYTEYCFFEG